ncbi:MAG TPA: hypothetical protein VHC22_26155 [Pirellulales bacterium]|nr:hypothetical protein [Pirellulales bacterium]
MVDERVYVARGPSGLGIFLAIVVVLLIVVGVLWGSGSLVVGHDANNRFQVTFDPGRAEHAGDDVLDKTGKALEHAGEKMQRQAHKPSPPQPAQQPIQR